MVVMLRESPKISIAALPGPAVGAGIGLALTADLRIAAALAWAREIAAGPRGAFELVKETVRDAHTLDLRAALPRESERVIRSGRSQEHRDTAQRRLSARH
jgi:2-(1,2-epoxy-1,2-dihydrophenyl)acetyl-CoA isomerase